MKFRAAILSALLAVASLTTFALAAKPPAADGITPAMPKTAPGTPTAAIRQLADAYEHVSVPELAAVLAADYRFHFAEGDSCGAGYLDGFDRETELKRAVGIFQSFSKIRTSVRTFESGPDPEHPESPTKYRVVVAKDLKLHAEMKRDNGKKEIVENFAADHVFYLVRGDAAVLAPGQDPSPNRWYVRHWFESAAWPAERLAKVDGHCDEAVAQAPAPLPHTLAVHAVDSPLCSTLKLLCDLPEALPATVEVFDIAGRRLSQRTLTPSSPGVTMPVEAGNGARFAPGAYFVRLSQGRQKPVSRMVLVAR